VRHRRGRALRRRYGRATGHLPVSRLSLDTYGSQVGIALHRLGFKASLLNEDERLMELNGWRMGTTPGTLAVKIGRARTAQARRAA
jgi:hypothetical protein